MSTDDAKEFVHVVLECFFFYMCSQRASVWAVKVTKFAYACHKSVFRFVEVGSQRHGGIIMAESFVGSKSTAIYGGVF